MPLNLPRPISYAITSGTTSSQATPDHSDSATPDLPNSRTPGHRESTTLDEPEFASILRLTKAAVIHKIPLFQIREKALPTRMRYDLVSRAVEITRGTSTRLLVNDRFDVALAAGADGVHLTSVSLPAHVVRQVCGLEFLIGVSTHSLGEALVAREGGADFIVFGPVFETESKRAFGPPQGLEELQRVTTALGDFPVLAIGGVTLDNAKECLAVGVSGFAGISWFSGSEP